MKKTTVSKRGFFDLFSSPAFLKVEYSKVYDEQLVEVKNILYPQQHVDTVKQLRLSFPDERLTDFFDFYESYNGFELAKILSSDVAYEQILLTQIFINDFDKVNKDYQPGGHYSFAIDFNKSKAMYRSNDKWIVFAEVHEGPGALAIFLTGEKTGQIFFIITQPHFNILRPIASSYTALLNRIAKDPAAFLKVLRATVIVKGLTINGEPYMQVPPTVPLRFGCLPFEYIDTFNKK